MKQYFLVLATIATVIRGMEMPDSGTKSKDIEQLNQQLITAVKDKQFDQVKELLQNSADPDATDSHESTPLHWAVHDTSIDIIELLFSFGANPNAHNEWEVTPLDLALENSSRDIAILLIRHGTNINRKNSLGETYLHVAAERGQAAMVQLLLDHGANPHQKNDDGKDALHLAQDNAKIDDKYKNIIEILQAHKRDKNSLYGETSAPKSVVMGTIILASHSTKPI